MQNFRLQLDQEHTNMSEPLVFSGGELHIDLSYLPEKCYNWSLLARLQSSDDIMHLFLLVDALERRYEGVLGSITIPYLPYARQDRVCAEGQHFGLDVIAKLLSTIKHKIKVYDPHSEVTSSAFALNNKYISTVDQNEVIANSWLHNEIEDGSLQLVAPDKGSLNKIFEIHFISGSKWPVAECGKTRDPKTGKITGFTCNVDDFEGRDLLICDDICDGGGTFLGLAALLKERNCGKITLYVTHGIFSKGFDCFSGLIDNIVTTTSFNRSERSECFRGTVASGVNLDTIIVR